MRRASKKRRLRKLPLTARKGRKGQILILQPAFPRKSVLQKIASYARSMGAHTQPTVPVSVVSMRKTELKSLVSAPLRKAEREVIPRTRTLRS
jgi:hypothetical protein